MAGAHGNKESDESGKRQGMVHDSLARAMLSDPGRAHDFLRHNLPNKIAGLLDGKPPVLKPDTFIDPNLDRTQADLLFEVGLASGKPALLYVLVEAKSSNDHRTPLQLATYMLRIWSNHVESGAGKPNALPPIIPVVLYHGREKWTAPASLAKALDTAGESELVFEPGSYILRDISHLPVEELSANPELRAGEIALSGRVREHKDDMLDGLNTESEFGKQVMAYIAATCEWSTANQVARALDKRSDKEGARLMDNMVMTAEAKGRVEGRAEGRVEGRVEGEAKSLTRVLEQRFGPLPRSARDRIAAASIEQLDAWFDSVLKAASLDELLGQTKAS